MDWAIDATSLVRGVTTLSALWSKYLYKHQPKHVNCHSCKFCSLLYIWLWSCFSSGLMNQWDILFLVYFFQFSFHFLKSLLMSPFKGCLPSATKNVHLYVFDWPTWCQWWRTEAKVVPGKKKYFFSIQPVSFCCCGANAILSLEWMRILHIFDTVLLLDWTQHVYVCLSVWRLRGM